MANQALAKHRDSFLQGWNSDTNTQRIKRFLPKDVPFDVFTSVVIRAVQEDPALLAVDDKTSLFLACQRAAQDGLMPDKREGALIVYRTKDGSKVQWQPMIHGLRKKLANHGFDMRAEVVYENDKFDYELGDTPQITHKRPKLGTPRGETVGAYAIATEKSSGRMWRDVMSREELDAVAAVSRSQSGPWSGPFRSEMYRKTVAKRLFKQLPLIAPDVVDVIDRDNEQFAFDDIPLASEQAQTVQEKARKRAAKEPTPPTDDVIEGDVEDVPTDMLDEEAEADF